MQTEALQRAMNVLGTAHIGTLNHEPYDHPEYGWKRPLSCNACARLVIEEMLYGGPGSSAATTERRLVECPYCGRTVETFRDPERGTLMFGHRAPLTGITDRPKSEWPWCQGGGRSV